jgi:hypothetical protein
MEDKVALDPVQFKRQILAESERTGIRKKLIEGQQETGIGNDDILEMGAAFESLTKTKGWAYVEAYILKRANLVSMLFEDDNPARRGEARALVMLMQYVDQVMRARNELIARAEKAAGDAAKDRS